MSERWKVTDAGITGVCTKCGRTFPAMGLIPVDQYVPTREVEWWNSPEGREHSGWKAVMNHIIGWFCAGCRPRGFGRVMGKPIDGWVCAPSDGSDLDLPSEKKGMSKFLPALGEVKSTRKVAVRKRKPRKMQPMKPL